MNNLSKLWAVLFFVLILTLVTEISTLNWFEAQEQCRDRDGLTIETRKSDQSYWTGRYRRITPWIKIMGCFSESFLSNISTDMYINVTMWKKAVGICQETCQRKNTTVFAVKGAECLCIKDVGTTFWPKSENPRNCNYKCFNKTTTIYKSECGGDSYYNVFEFSSRISGSYNNYKDNNNCLSLQCSKSDIRFIPNSCSEPLSKVCQIKGSSSQGTGGNWTNTMMDCKSANPPAYLFGDIDFQNATVSCKKTFIQNDPDLRWIGVARQFYLNKDEGLEFLKEVKHLIFECQTCNKTKCQYITCNADISHPEVCTRQNSIVVQTSPSSPISLIDTKPMETKTPPNEPTTSISSYETRYTTDEKMISVQVSTSKTSLRMGAEDNNSDHVIILAVIAVLGVVIISAAMLIFYLRRKRLRQSEAPKKTTTEILSDKAVCVEEGKSSNNPYFLLEKDAHGISSRSLVTTESPYNDTESPYNDKESPYNDTEEGEYDHLRDIRSRKDEEEDTYQHASVGIPDDVSDYDTMANSAVKKTPDEEGTYDHAHPMTNRNSDYGYNVTIDASLNDNPYDMAERK